MKSPLSILNSVFGYHEFRGPEARAINALVQRDDVLVLMPAGGGLVDCR